MPRSERQPIRSALPRGQGELLRGELVAAATELLLAPQDVAPPSLRAIARHVGVVPSAVYRHFDSAEALTAVVVAEQFDALRSALRQAVDPLSPPRARLLRAAGAYYRWAIEHPGAYQLLFERPDVPASIAEPPGVDLLALFSEPLRALGHRERQAADAAVSMWAAVHGLTSLRIHKPAAPWRRSVEDDLADLITALEPRPAPPRPHQPPPVSS